VKYSNNSERIRVKLVRYPEVLLHDHISCLSAQNWRQMYGVALKKTTNRSPVKSMPLFQGHEFNEPFASIVFSWVSA